VAALRSADPCPFDRCYRVVVRTLDRYVIREILPPFLLALGLFTFVLAINPMLGEAKRLLATGIPVPTVGLLLALLVPQALSLTIPMALLTGLLMALGRISGDRESVALLACGVSPLRLLRPVLAVAFVVAAVDMFILMKVKPDANQTWREITFSHLAEKTATEIRPRIFFEQFPGLVLFVGDTAPGGAWSQVLLADTKDPARPVVTLADSGRLDVNRDERQVSLILANATQYTPGRDDPRAYNTVQSNPLTIKITAESVFGAGDIAYPRGLPEMGYAQLKARAEEHRAQGISTHNETMHLQQMFSFPAACLVLALLGLPVGLSTRKEGRLAALAVGLAIIAVYYLLMELAEGWVKGEAWTGGPTVPAELARWVPNIVLGLLGVAALWRSARTGNARPLIALPRLWMRSRAAAESPEGRAVPSGRVRLVLRVPELLLPLPRLLDRYVSRQYLRMIGLSFLALLTLYYIGAVVDLAEKVFKGQAGQKIVLQYLLYSTPEFISFVIPIATLVGVLGTIGALSRTGELMVMRASGVSLYRASLPLVLFAVVWGGVLFVLEDRVLGESRKTAGALKDSIRGRAPHNVDLANLTWTVGEDGRIYHYAAFETASRQNGNRPALHALSVFETATAPYRLTKHTSADRVVFEAGSWQAQSGWTQAFAGDAVTRHEFDRAALPLPPVEHFRRARVDASQMSYTELRDYVRRLGASGFNVAEQAVNLEHKLAFPAVTIVMTLLAIPFGVTTGKKGALYGIGLATVLASSYFLLLTIFMAIGAAGVLPPALAAWGPNILFGSGALFLMLTVRT
jgi:LPS export ABC transporter permease LptG/LPS export ABC transporter permease LptF